MIGRFLKRMLDIVVSLVVILFSSPLLMLISLCILLEDGFPIIFVQERVGRFNRQFRIMKFRSMKVNQKSVTELGQVYGSDHPLLLRIGKVIRRLKIDELPQLFNILCGQMSLVGPRPTVQTSIDAMTDYHKRRLEVRPGITGWAQVNGNIEVSWEDRASLDVWYIDHWSFWLDIRILVATMAVVLFGEKPKMRAIEEARAYANCAQRSGGEHASDDGSIA